jgi:hypothetical protein
MRVGRHVARIKGPRNTFQTFIESKHKILFEDAGVDEDILLKLTINIYSVGVWAGFFSLKIRTSGGLL